MLVADLVPAFTMCWRLLCMVFPWRLDLIIRNSEKPFNWLIAVEVFQSKTVRIFEIDAKFPQQSRKIV